MGYGPNFRIRPKTTNLLRLSTTGGVKSRSVADHFPLTHPPKNFFSNRFASHGIGGKHARRANYEGNLFAKSCHCSTTRQVRPNRMGMDQVVVANMGINPLGEWPGIFPGFRPCPREKPNLSIGRYLPRLQLPSGTIRIRGCYFDFTPFAAECLAKRKQVGCWPPISWRNSRNNMENEQLGLPSQR